MRKGHTEILRRAERDGLPRDYIHALAGLSMPLAYIERCRQMLSLANASSVRYENITSYVGQEVSQIDLLIQCITMHLESKALDYVMQFKQDNKFQLLMDLLQAGYDLEDAKDLFDFCCRNRRIRTRIFSSCYNSPLIFTYDYSVRDIPVLKEYALHGFLFDPRTAEFGLRNKLDVKQLQEICPNGYPDAQTAAETLFPELRCFSCQGTWRSPEESLDDVLEKAKPLLQYTEEVTLSIPFVERWGGMHESCYSFIFVRSSTTRLRRYLAEPYGGKRIFESKLLIFYSGGIYKETAQGRVIPFTIKDIPWFEESYGDLFSEIFEAYMSHFPQDRIFKDIVKAAKDASFLPPIPLNSCIGCHSPKELATAHYKNADGINWNKLGLEKGYLFMKARRVINKKSQGILSNYFYNTDVIDKALETRQREYTSYSVRKGDAYEPELFALRAILSDKLDTKGDPFSITDIYIRDYLRTSRKLKEKISLAFNGEGSLKEAHDAVSDRFRAKAYPKGQIVQKKSRFNALRKKLPADFEQLKTAKRMFAEHEMQQNCVHTYVSSVQADECAIYSWVHENERYTIEFGKDGNHYSIRQMMKKCNVPASPELVKYVSNLIA